MASRYDENRDLGYGSVALQRSKRRLLNRNGGFNVVRDGLPWWASLSLYHALLRLSWPRLRGLLSLAYVTVNTLFATAYVLCGRGALHGPTPIPAEGRFLIDDPRQVISVDVSRLHEIERVPLPA